MRMRMGGASDVTTATGITNKMEAAAAKGSTSLNMAHVFNSLNSKESSLVEKRQVITKAHCEDRLACTVAMRSPEEYKYWLGEYIKALAANEEVDTIRMIAEELMKGEQGKEDGVGAGETFGWSDCNELGLDKLKVMKEVVIKTLGGIRDSAIATKLLIEYGEELGM
jgi:hypothetical protein